MANGNVVSFRLSKDEANEMLKMAAMHGVGSSAELTKKLVQNKLEKYRNLNELNLARFVYDLSMPNNNLGFKESQFEMEASRSLLHDQNNFIKDEGFPNTRILQILRGEKRDMSVGLAENYGSDLVGSNVDPSRFRIIPEPTLQELEIEVQKHDGQNLTIPLVTAEGIAGWVPTEGAGVTEDTPSTDKLELTPKFANSYHEETRMFLLSSGANASDKIIESISADIYAVIVDGIFNGTGADGEPEGLDNNSSVQSVDGTDFILTTAINIIKTSHNAKYSANKKWCMNYNTFSSLASRDVGTDTGKMLIQMINGKPYMGFYPVVFSSKVNDNQIFFGDFSANTHLVVFGNAIDLFVKKAPVTAKKQFDASLPVDFAFQNPTSFVKTSIT